MLVVPQRVNASELAPQAPQRPQVRDHEVRMPPRRRAGGRAPDLAVPDDNLAQAAVLAVCIGGDGTMLRTAKLLHGAAVPIIGVNVGLLGYLTEVEPPSLPLALERWFAGPEAGHWHLDERMMLDLTVHAAGREPQSWTAR